VTLTRTRLKNLVRVQAGTWGEEPGVSDVDVFCVRAADFDRVRLRVDSSRLPVRSVDVRTARDLALHRGDIVIEKSGGGADQPVGAAVLFDLESSAICSNFAARLRPVDGVESRYLTYLLASMYYRGVTAALAKQTTGIANLDTPALLATECHVPSRVVQSAIANYLETEISVMDNLIEEKRRLTELLQEQIDSAIMELVGQSVVISGDQSLRALPIRRQLAKLDRPPEPDAQVITAFRDGQVTARALRRAGGYTESWTEAARVQGVMSGDVVVHGLDGFAGAIGTSEADGVCSPVYHVCSPIDGGDAHFYGRMLRLLATTGYLGNFATSTRERAVDFRNWDLFGRIPIPVVDATEQRRIGDRIRRLAPIRERVDRSEVLIDERKRALITAAVTGLIEIPGVAA
jgi:type I restriction enzyme S subunit